MAFLALVRVAVDIVVLVVAASVVVRTYCLAVVAAIADIVAVVGTAPLLLAAVLHTVLVVLCIVVAEVLHMVVALMVDMLPVAEDTRLAVVGIRAVFHIAAVAVARYSAVQVQRNSFH